MQIKTTNRGTVRLRKGKEFTMLTVRIGGIEENEIWYGDEFQREMENYFAEYSGLECTVLNYLLMRLRWYNGHKASIKLCQYKVDESNEMVETSYPIEVTGTYRNGKFKVEIEDEYVSYLDDDSIVE